MNNEQEMPIDDFERMLIQVRPAAVVPSVEETFYRAGFEACKAQLCTVDTRSSIGRFRFCYGLVVGAAASLMMAMILNVSSSTSTVKGLGPNMAVHPSPLEESGTQGLQVTPVEPPAMGLIENTAKETVDSVPVSTQFFYNGIRAIVAANSTESKFAKPIKRQELLTRHTGLLIGTLSFNEREEAVSDQESNAPNNENANESSQVKVPQTYLFPIQDKRLRNPSF